MQKVWPLDVQMQSDEFRWHDHECCAFRNPMELHDLSFFYLRRNSIGVSMTPISSLSLNSHMDEQLLPPIPHSFQSYLYFCILNTKREAHFALYKLPDWMVLARTASPVLNCHQCNMSNVVLQEMSHVCVNDKENVLWIWFKTCTIHRQLSFCYMIRNFYGSGLFRKISAGFSQ